MRNFGGDQQDSTHTKIFLIGTNTKNKTEEPLNSAFLLSCARRVESAPRARRFLICFFCLEPLSPHRAPVTDKGRQTRNVGIACVACVACWGTPASWSTCSPCALLSWWLSRPYMLLAQFLDQAQRSRPVLRLRGVSAVESRLLVWRALAGPCVQSLVKCPRLHFAATSWLLCQHSVPCSKLIDVFHPTCSARK